MGGWEHLEGQSLHGHAEWVETRDLTGQIFDSHLTIKVMLWPFEVFPYVCIGSHLFAMFSAHALHEGGQARTSM